MTPPKIMGRPRKADAVKPGELAKGMVRFGFIVEDFLAGEIRRVAKDEGRSIKDVMQDMILSYLHLSGRLTKNEQKLFFLRKKKKPIPQKLKL